MIEDKYYNIDNGDEWERCQDIGEDYVNYDLKNLKYFLSNNSKLGKVLSNSTNSDNLHSSSKIREARKIYKCSKCRKKISIGDYYIRTNPKFVKSFTTCLECGVTKEYVNKLIEEESLIYKNNLNKININSKRDKYQMNDRINDFTNGIQKNFCFLAQKECVYCNNLGKCELTGYCYYKTSPPSYGTTTTPNEIIFVKAPDILPEVLVINGERYIKEHKT